MGRVVLFLALVACLAGIGGSRSLAELRAAPLPASPPAKVKQPSPGTTAPASPPSPTASPLGARAASPTSTPTASPLGARAASPTSTATASPLTARAASPTSTPTASPLTARAASPATLPPREDATARLDFLCERLDKRQRNLQLWWGIWVGVHTTMGAAQALLAGYSDRIFQDPRRARAYRNSFATGAATSGVGLVAALLSYPAGLRGCRAARLLRDGTSEGDAKALALAEKTLRDTAGGLKFGRSWLTHVGGVLVSLAAGLVLWLAFDQPIDGAVQLAAGTAVAEIQVWTQPTAAIRDWDAYLRRFPTLVPASHQMLSPGPGWRLVPHPGGLGLVITY